MPPFSPPIEFDTERLTLRQWREADFASFARLNADPKVMEYFSKPLTPSESDALAQALQSFIQQHGFGLWAAELKDTGEFIGFVGLSVPKAELPFSPCVEVGWRLAAAHWGKGYAPEAAKEALRIGFERCELTEIVSFTALDNRRSRKVMEKLGMQEDAATFEHPNVPVGHPLREHCLYRISRQHWQSVRARNRPSTKGKTMSTTNTVRLHRVLTAKPEKVYRAFLEPDALARWLPPNGFTGKVHHLDAKTGGTFKMSFTNFTTSTSISFGGDYLELVQNERLRYTDKFDDPHLPGVMTVTVDLKKVSVGTELNIVQEGIPAVIPLEACYLGWQESLRNLARLVEPEIPN